MSERIDAKGIDGGDGFVHLRRVEDGVALAISELKNGDAEVILDDESAARLRDALQQWLDRRQVR